MENNEENLGSQEPVTQSVESEKSAKSPNTRLIGIVAVAIVAVLAIVLFFVFAVRSPKAVAKDFITATMIKPNTKKAVNLVDFEGVKAFSAISSYSYSKGYTYNFEDFDDEYKEVKKDKDFKEEIKEQKKKMLESDDVFGNILDDSNVSKVSIEDIETEKIDDCKKLTKVTITLKAKVDGEYDEQDFVVYTMQKGLKNYIVGFGY